MKFKFSINLIIQILGVSIQILNFASGMVSAEWQPIIAAIVGTIQAVTALLAHFRNPDGTSATVAYRP